VVQTIMCSEMVSILQVTDRNTIWYEVRDGYRFVAAFLDAELALVVAWTFIQRRGQSECSGGLPARQRIPKGRTYKSRPAVRARPARAVQTT
jgi:hypothetical protein